MRIALIILIALHGIIHLFGFLKAFNLAKFNAISQPISKTSGLLWLILFIVFATAVSLLISESKIWWLPAFLAVIGSQLLIINFWHDAKFGTILNLIILVSALIAYASFSFNNTIAAERSILLKNTQTNGAQVITEKTISELPVSVQKWLKNNGTVGKRPVSNVHLKQALQLKLNPEQENWNTGKAEQYVTTHPPAFHWTINTKINSIFSIVGRDKFEAGNGEMTIKLLSLIPVADAKNSHKVNQASLQRFLAEIVWFPSASLSKYITWQPINSYSAKATLEYNGTKGSGEFHFDENGNFKKFVAMRFKDSNAIEPTKWMVNATQIEERNGIKIPVACEASWEQENGVWTWLKLKITEINYNIM
ncbi:DUF6920 family protein [Bizionia sediminis]|uniref:DUF6920 family protein n=1 Tax=Bizionia sediminis TaxID=1737064 RepID=A0ABW5KU59_9FLAO